MLMAEWLRAVREGHAGALAIERGRTTSLATSLYPMLSVASNRPFGTSHVRPFTAFVTGRLGLASQGCARTVTRPSGV